LQDISSFFSSKDAMFIKQKSRSLNVLVKMLQYNFLSKEKIS